MSMTVTVACPHCGSTGSYRLGVTSGSAAATCTNPGCRHMFRVYVQNSMILRVVK